MTGFTSDPNAGWGNLMGVGETNYIPSSGGLDLQSIEAGDAALPTYVNLGNTTGNSYNIDDFFGSTDGVDYAQVFGPSTSAFDSLMQEITGIGEKSMIDKASGWIKDNKELASMLAAGGAGLLKNLGQQSMLEDQREWVSKRDAEKRAQDLEDRDHQEKLRKFAPVSPLKTGLLDSVKKRTEGAKA